MAGELGIGPDGKVMGSLDMPGMDPRIRRNFQWMAAKGFKLKYGDNLEVIDGRLWVKLMDRVDDVDGNLGLNLLFDSMQAAILMDSWYVVDESANQIVDESGNYIIG